MYYNISDNFFLPTTKPKKVSHSSILYQEFLEKYMIEISRQNKGLLPKYKEKKEGVNDYPKALE